MATKAKVGEQPVNIRLPRDLHEQILARAEKDDRTLAAEIRVAIRYFLERSEAKPAPAFDPNRALKLGIPQNGPADV